MGVAMTLREFLDDNHVAYDVIAHKETGCSSMTARVSHVPGEGLAKGVVLKWDEGFLLAVLPTTRHVDLESVGQIVSGPVTLATEDEASRLFPDCDEGAVPALAAAYGVPAVIDEELCDRADIYFEGGDHRSLVHISGEHFDRLMCGAPHARFSH